MKSDALMKHEVLCELKWDTHVDDTEVMVEVDKGTVTLTGTVGHYGKKVAAQEAAHRVDGVRDVVNDLMVHIPAHLARTDKDIAQMVRQVLTWDVRVPEERITSTVSDGWVTLEGQVDVWGQRNDPEHAVRHLACVRGVNNLITVHPAQVAPQDVHQAIHDALARRAALEANRIQVHIRDGTVILTGHVGAWKEKLAIIEAVSHAPGVETVEDHLDIAPYV